MRETQRLIKKILVLEERTLDREKKKQNEHTTSPITVILKSGNR